MLDKKMRTNITVPIFIFLSSIFLSFLKRGGRRVKRQKDG